MSSRRSETRLVSGRVTRPQPSKNPKPEQEEPADTDERAEHYLPVKKLIGIRRGLYDKGMIVAHQEHRTFTELVNEALRDYLKKCPSCGRSE